ncbi:hypothetical protein [Tersicoccus sp. Bi-70]|uniref:hypothetical protein n=1 Tax=Tersicoccus sp. Bi-70 TaxID=1897634 RepID=UPI000977BDC4|nr:hypothetical protein [Tersicoccus sp. Bi-70]OMH30610.1 hypothetical protein BGP79_11650 [Tersicoccus sp. Bi-70]
MDAPRRLRQSPRRLTFADRRRVRHALASGASDVVAITLDLDELDLAVATVTGATGGHAVGDHADRAVGDDAGDRAAGDEAAGDEAVAGREPTPLDVVALARRVDRRLRVLARRETVLRGRLEDRSTRTTALRAPAAEFARRASAIRQECLAVLAVASLQTRAPGWERIWDEHVAPVLSAPEEFAALAARAGVVGAAAAPVIARLDEHRRALLAVDAEVRAGSLTPASALRTVATATAAVADVLDEAVDALLVTRFSPRHRRSDPTYRGRQERRHLVTATRSAARLPPVTAVLLDRDGETADEVLTVGALSDWWTGVLLRDRSRGALRSRHRRNSVNGDALASVGISVGVTLLLLAVLLGSGLVWSLLLSRDWAFLSIPTTFGVALVLPHAVGAERRAAIRSRRSTRRRLAAVGRRIRALYTAEDALTLDALVAQTRDRHALSERERLARTTLLAFRRHEELTARPRIAQATDRHARDVEALALQVEAVHRRGRALTAEAPVAVVVR